MLCENEAFDKQVYEALDGGMTGEKNLTAVSTTARILFSFSENKCDGGSFAPSHQGAVNKDSVC